MSNETKGPQPPAEAQPCGCGEATCTVPWEPGCGLGKSEQHAEAQAQGGGEVCIEAHWLENVAAAASLLEASGDVFNVREAAALRKLIASAERAAPPSAPDYPITATCKVCDYGYRCVPVPSKCGTCGSDLPPSAPVGVEGLVERMRQAPDRLWMADLVGQKISVERMRDILTFALAQQPAAEAESRFYSQDFYEETRAGSKPWPGGSNNDR